MEVATASVRLTCDHAESCDCALVRCVLNGVSSYLHHHMTPNTLFFIAPPSTTLLHHHARESAQCFMLCASNTHTFHNFGNHTKQNTKHFGGRFLVPPQSRFFSNFSNFFLKTYLSNKKRAKSPICAAPSLFPTFDFTWIIIDTISGGK